MRNAVVAAVIAAVIAIGCSNKKRTGIGVASSDAAVATTPTADAAPQAPVAGQLTPFLYKIDKAGKTSWLLGTIDAGVDANALLPATVWDRVKASKTVVLQWNLAEMTIPMMKRASGTLSTDLTADEKTRLVKAVGEKFVADMETSKPWFVASVLSAQGLETRNPMQPVINQVAQDAGIATVYLETAVVLEATLDKWLDGKAVKAAIAALDTVAADNAALRTAFVAGDEAALSAMVDKRMPWKTAGRSGAALDAMKQALVARHAAWVTFLKPLLDAGDAFVAVDVFDLIGPGGLVEILGKDGYTVLRTAR
jgi:uncharacterized protein YbaP (TraB family)